MPVRILIAPATRVQPNPLSKVVLIQLSTAINLTCDSAVMPIVQVVVVTASRYSISPEVKLLVLNDTLINSSSM